MRVGWPPPGMLYHVALAAPLAWLSRVCPECYLKDMLGNILRGCCGWFSMLQRAASSALASTRARHSALAYAMYRGRMWMDSPLTLIIADGLWW